MEERPTIINGERRYCKYCGAKLKKDCCGLICPENHLHENNDALGEKDE